MRSFIFLFILIAIPYQQLPAESSTSSSVIINEVELNPRGIDSYTSVTEWIELYNTSDSIVDVGGWSVSSSALSTRSSAIRIPGGIVIPAKGYLLVYSESPWLNDFNETVSLLDSNKRIVYQAGPFNDDYDDGSSWQTMPDGSDTWVFKWNTKQMSNSITKVIAASNLTIVDQAGITQSKAITDQKASFQFDLKNDTRELLELLYMVQIKDSNGFTQALLSSTALLAAEQKFTVVQPWTPEQMGCYTIEIFVWQSVINPIVLSHRPLRSSLCVAAEDVICKQELSLMIPSSETVACVKPLNVDSELNKEKASGNHNTHENVLTVKVLDRKTKSPISDATVIVAKKSGKIVVWKITDKNGTQQLHVPSGDYYIMIKASCCYSRLDNLHIRGDMEKIFELVDR